MWLPPRASAWALTYFLAQQKLTGLQAYFKELSKMPRDIDLDDKALIACFARAMNCTLTLWRRASEMMSRIDGAFCSCSTYSSRAVPGRARSVSSTEWTPPSPGQYTIKVRGAFPMDRSDGVVPWSWASRARSA